MLKRLRRAVRYRLGMPVVAPLLEDGTDNGVIAYYNSRASLCSFLHDSDHYERPRVDWILKTVSGGRLLEIGCADGGMTELLAPSVDYLDALDVCKESVNSLSARALPNVRGHTGLVESFNPSDRYQWIVMSEFLEHARNPEGIVKRALEWLAPGGRLLASSPEGRWESDSIEHLQVFDLQSWSSLFAKAGARSIHAFRIRDRDGRDRWLGADVATDG